MKNLSILENKLQYKFRNKKLLIEALTHRSFNKPYNNERFEFVGDSILSYTMATYLFHKFPNLNEGSLSKLRSSLVSQSGLYKIAEYFELGEYLLISEAEEKNLGRKKRSLLSNCVESIIASIYFDSNQDIKMPRKFIIQTYETVFPHISLETLFRDYKTILQEMTQSIFGVVPEYKVLETSGPDHEKLFTIGLYINERLYVTSSGRSKKSAEQNSAELAIRILEDTETE